MMMMMIVRGCSPAHDDEATDPGVDTGLQGPRDVVRQGLAHPHHQGLRDADKYKTIQTYAETSAPLICAKAALTCPPGILR